MRLAILACLIFWVSIAIHCKGAEVKLAWNPNDPAQKVTSYEVQAAEVWGFQIITVETPETTATVSGLKPGTDYFFSVRAFNAVGASDFSEAIMGAPPIMLRLTMQRSTDLATWTDLGDVVRVEKKAAEFFRVKMEVEP